MSEQGTAPAADAPLSVRDAGALISSTPAPKEREDNSEAAAPVTADTPPIESGLSPDAGPAQEPVPGETEDADPALKEPSIEPPRSWSKEHKEAFEALPRHIQQAVAENERAREADFSQKTRAAAEHQKAVEAREQAAERTRQQYEQALPVLLGRIEADMQGEFGNPTPDEIQQWARTEPDKYIRWDAALKQRNIVASELQQRQVQQHQQNLKAWQDYAKAEWNTLVEKAPEFADEKSAPTRQAEYRSYMQGLGYSHEELMDFQNNLKPMTLHDHRLQLIIRDAVRYKAAEAALKKTQPKSNVPPVQRPGPAPAKGEARQAQLKDLDRKLDATGSLRDAAKLLGARRRAS